MLRTIAPGSFTGVPKGSRDILRRKTYPSEWTRGSKGVPVRAKAMARGGRAAARLTISGCAANISEKRRAKADGTLPHSQTPFSILAVMSGVSRALSSPPGVIMNPFRSAVLEANAPVAEVKRPREQQRLTVETISPRT